MTVEGPYQKIIDIVSKNRNIISSQEHIRAASDDYNWRDEEGYPIYSIVEYSIVDGARTVRQTRSLNDAMLHLEDIDPDIKEASIRVGGVPLITNKDVDLLKRHKPIDLPFSQSMSDIVEILKRDSERWKGKNPSVWPGEDVLLGRGKNTYSVGFGAKLDTNYRMINDSRKVGDISLSPEMEVILRAAEKRGVPDHEIDRLSNFAAFVKEAGSVGSTQDLDKAWERTMSNSIDPEELSAAWKKRRKEMLEEAKAEVKKTINKTLHTSRAMITGIWDTLTKSPSRDLGTSRDLMGYASALLDTSNVIPESMKEKMPEYMNAYRRGVMLGDHLCFKETLPENVADVISPVMFMGNPKEQFCEITHHLPAHDFLKAINVINSREDSPLFSYNGQLCDANSMANLVNGLSVLRQDDPTREEDLTVERARYLGGVMYTLLNVMGPVNEREFFQAININGNDVFSDRFDVRGALADGFEDALRNDRSQSRGPRMTAFLAALDGLQKTDGNSHRETLDNVQNVEKLPEKPSGETLSMNVLMGMGTHEEEVPSGLIDLDDDDGMSFPDGAVLS